MYEMRSVKDVVAVFSKPKKERRVVMFARIVENGENGYLGFYCAAHLTRGSHGAKHSSVARYSSGGG